MITYPNNAESLTAHEAKLLAGLAQFRESIAALRHNWQTLPLETQQRVLKMENLVDRVLQGDEQALDELEATL